MRRILVVPFLIAGLATTPALSLTNAVEGPVIAAAGDIACPTDDPQYNGGLGTATECAQMRTSDLLVAGNYARVLTLGDLQYPNGELAEFQAVYDPSWGRVRDITAPSPGNHEHNQAGAPGYYDYWNGVGNDTGPAGERGKGYYSFDVGTWHLIALNSSCGPKGVIGGCAGKSPMITWLKADLAAHPNTEYLCTLAYWHHPRYSSETPNKTPMKPAWAQLYKFNVDLVLNGHKHHYERFAPQDNLAQADPARGIRQIIVGTGGKDAADPQPQLLPNSEAWGSAFGILEVALNDGSYAWSFRPEAGGTFSDSGSTACH